MKIFVVEDEKRVRNGLITIINKLNPDYQVIGEAEDGQQGYELIRKLEPDVVFTDIKMPDVDGLEMMERLSMLRKKPIIIILTGYSDFEFAKKAISFGVKEYLLKPVTVDDITGILERVHKDLLSKETKGELYNSHIYSLEKLLEDMLLSQHYNSQLCEFYLNEHFHKNNKQHYVLALMHFDAEDKTQIELMSKLAVDQLNKVFESVATVRIAQEKKLVALFVVDEVNGNIENQLDYNVFRVVRNQCHQNVVMGIMEMEGLSDLRANVARLKKDLKYTIVLGEEQLIVSKRIADYKITDSKFPEKIEKEALKALYSKNVTGLEAAKKSFIDYWKKQQCQPEQVADAFIRFTSSLLNAFKEINLNVYKKAYSTNAMRKLLESFTMKELIRVLEVVVGCYVNEEHYLQRGYGLLVVKAIEYLEENYMHPITLEEISGQLHVTSEYLSMLFRKEVGENYSSYLKRFRIEKAKYLLLNSELNIEQISEAIGYYNIKYFYRVFKSVSGLTPREYTNKYGV